MIKFARANFAKFCLILKFFTLHENFDGVHQVKNICNNQGMENNVFLVIFADARISPLHTALHTS